MTRILNLILNPQAAGGTARNRADKISSFFNQHGMEVNMHLTRQPRHAVEIARQLAGSGEQEIVSLGGDGTAFEVINGIMQSGRNQDVRLGILPLGTGNAFLKDFGLETWKASAEKIIQGQTRPVDAGACTMLNLPEQPVYYFYNLLGMGLFAEASSLRHQIYYPLGKFAYIAAFFHLLVRLKHYPFRIRFEDGQERRVTTPLLAVCNSQFTGHRLHISPHSCTYDGKLELLYSEDLSSWELFQLFRVLSTGKHLKHPKVYYQHFTQVEIQVEQIESSNLDGEVVEGNHVKIEVAPSALQMYV
ncbi:MAG: diacylglycerol/lipid kinase family protein [bacterium]|jgi:diacylglycerol kinase (ATP)